jgi:hypothetical protein
VTLKGLEETLSAEAEAEAEAMSIIVRTGLADHHAPRSHSPREAVAASAVTERVLVHFTKPPGV